MGKAKRDWMQKTARFLNSQTNVGYQKSLLFIREHRDEIIALAKRLPDQSVSSMIPFVGHVYGSRVPAAEAVWDKYHEPALYAEFLSERGLSD